MGRRSGPAAPQFSCAHRTNLTSIAELIGVRGFRVITEHSLLPQRLAWRADFTPKELAYSFRNAAGETETWTYADTYARAIAIAAHLHRAGAKTADRVLLAYSPGLEFVAALFGCFFAGCIGVPVPPPKQKRGIENLEKIASDCGARFFLSEASVIGRAQGFFGTDSVLTSICWTASSEVKPVAEPFVAHPSAPDDLAVLQYTSGSTGSPKGVMLSHANLLNNARICLAAERVSRDMPSVSWLPVFHDMGLMLGVLEPMFSGRHAVLMSAADFLRAPLTWMKTISDFRAGATAAPNFAYQMCVDAQRAAPRETFDLLSLRCALCGAEPVRPETVRSFIEVFAPRGFRSAAFRPAYGLAESTVGVTLSREGEKCLFRFNAEKLRLGQVVEDPEGQEWVACGRPLNGVDVIIVDPTTRRRVQGVGEIWVRSSSVGSGYFGQRAESEEIFAAKLAEGAESRWLRTGDLGFVFEEQLFVSGRLKDLVIVRGVNHYPQDLEATAAAAHPALQSNAGAAFSVVRDGVEELIIVHEVDRTFRGPFDEMLQNIRRAIVASHEIEPKTIVLIKEASLPKTTSGKVRRGGSREAFLQGQLHARASWSATEYARPAKVLRPNLDSFLLDAVARLTGLEASRIDPAASIGSLGLDSRKIVELFAELSEFAGEPLSPTLAWDYPSLAELTRYLASRAVPKVPERDVPRSSGEAIAIVGIGCRFPEAQDAEAYWQLLVRGGNTSAPAPDRFLGRGCYGRDMVGSFLDAIDHFDARFFGISPREAESMDPQQRLLLEVTWAALEDACIRPDSLRGTDTAVYVGIANSDYALRILQNSQIDPYFGIGNAHSIAANRISYALDLRGPSMALDTACSSSLVAVHMACESLRRRDATVAVAGGVNVILSSEVTSSFAQARMLSPDGRCKVFDAAADGYGRGEGCGVVILKRLEDAIRDRDSIYAVIRGSAVNQDGRTNGLTAPNGLAQQDVIARAHQHGGTSARDVGYVELHGTGTPLGDPIEFAALRNAFQTAEHAGECFLGSAKANIGHAEAAAGIAGLIKCALVLHRGLVPGNPHLRQLNPHIQLEGTPFRFPVAPAPFPRAAKFAAVSSFGFGGTNAHAVLQAPPVPEERNPGPHATVVKLAAKTPSALRTLSMQIANAIRLHPEFALEDIARSLNTGRSCLPIRAAEVVSTREELLQHLDRVAEQVEPFPSPRGPSKIAFLFSGQGGSYAGLGRSLFWQSPVFRAAFERCSAVTEQDFKTPLTPALLDAANDWRTTALAQTIHVAVQISLAHVWLDWGIRPSFVSGHSLGEIAALYVSGAYSLEDAMRFAYERGRLVHENALPGSMLAVFAAPDEVADVVARHRSDIAIAAYNGPRAIVVAGRTEAIELVRNELAARKVATAPLMTDQGFHSPCMDPVLDSLAMAAKPLVFVNPTLPFVSSVTGHAVEEGWVPDAGYLLDHLRKPVRYSDAIESLVALGAELFVEIGPGDALTTLGKRIVPKSKGGSWVAAVTGRTDEWRGLLSSVGKLFQLGIDVAWEKIPPPTGKFVRLPTYPFEGERYWIAENQSASRGEKPPVRPHVVFVFSGLGAQFRGMARSLYDDEPIFRDALDECLVAFQFQSLFDLRGYLLEYSTDKHFATDEVWRTGPALFAFQYAFARLWQSWGVEPAAVIGYSYSELAAACIAGAIPLNDAAVLAIRTIELYETAEPGALVVVGVSSAVAERRIRRFGEKLTIGVYITESLVVVSGETEAIKEFVAECERDEIWCTPWPVTKSFHSPTMDPLEKPLRKVLEQLHFQPPQIPWVSNRTGRYFDERQSALEHWATWLRAPTRFQPGIDALIEDGHRVFVEIGPRPLLSKLLSSKTPTAAKQDDVHFVSRASEDQSTPSEQAYRTRERLRDLGVRIDRISGRSGKESNATSVLYRVGWHRTDSLKIDPTSTPVSSPASKTSDWIVVCEQEDVASALRDELRPFAERVSVATQSEWRAMLDNAKRPVAVVYVDTNPASVHARLPEQECLRLHAIANHLLANAPSTPLSVAAIGDGGAVASFAKSLFLEHSSLAGSIVEVEDKSIESLRALAQELVQSPTDGPVRIRRGERFVHRVTTFDADEKPVPAFCCAPDGTYVITGGFGHLGLRTANWLAQSGARRIVLIGRTPPPPRREWARVTGRMGEVIQGIRDIERLGAAVSSLSADVSDAIALERAFDAIDDTSPPVRGIFHAAGTLSTLPAAALREHDFRAVFAAKVDGALHLNAIARRYPLDHFVLFSSISSLSGSRHLAHYTAANGALDAIVRARRAENQPATAVHFGPIEGGGMLDSDLARAWVGASGITAIDATVALSALERALERGEAEPVVGAVDSIRAVYEATHVASLFAALGRVNSASASATLRGTLAAIEPDARPAAILHSLRTEIARVLRLPSLDIDGHASLPSLGLDSLMAVELKRWADREFEIELPLLEIMKGMPLGKIADRIASNLSANVADGARSKVERITEPEARYEPFPLNDIQQAYWLGRSGFFEYGNIPAQGYVEFNCRDLDPARLESALRRLIDRHEMLRVVVDSDSTQRILETVPPYVMVLHDLRGLSSEAAQESLRATRKRLDDGPRRSVDSWPLFDIEMSLLGEGQSRLHVRIEMIAVDGWSVLKFLSEWASFYRDPSLALKPLAFTFRDYAASMQRFEQSPAFQSSERYWMRRIEELPPAPELPYRAEQTLVSVFRSRAARLDRETWNRLKARCREKNLTPSTVICAAFADVLAGWSKSKRFTLNCLYFNRQPIHEDVYDLIGNFSSTSLLAVDATAETFEKRASLLQDQLWRDLEFAHMTGVRVMRELNRRHGGSTRPTMPIVFASTLPIDRVNDNVIADWPGAITYRSLKTPQVLLDHQVSEFDGELVLHWDVVDDAFVPGAIDAMFAAYCSYLTRLASDSASWTERERRLVPQAHVAAYDHLNATKELRSEEPIHAAFLRRASEQPNAVAVISGARTLRYEELRQLSARVANAIRALDAKPNTLVAIIIEKGWAQVVAALGVTQSGAAYLPIDPELPDERVDHLLAQGNVRIVLCDAASRKRLAHKRDLHRIEVDDAKLSVYSDTTPQVACKPSDLAYVIFTSGSSGAPKGVMIEHRAAVNTLIDINARFQVSPSDRVLAISSLSFDLSVYDVFGTLAAGACVVIPSSSMIRDPRALAAEVSRTQVTIWNSVPALCELLVDHLHEAGRDARLPFRIAMLSGDWIPITLPARLRALAPAVRVISLGGATEASIWSIYYPIDSVDPSWKSIPYGRALKNQTMHVLDSNFEPCPNWVIGEIFIGGEGLARGYWRDEEKTQARFVHHPRTGQRLYRTGDLGRYFPDGMIEFLGREDFQVKIRGFRIELGEIEAVLADHPAVRSAVTLAIGAGASRQLVAHVATEATDLTAATLGEHLASKLPAYMVPQAIVLHSELPLSSNGKVDRSALAKEHGKRDAASTKLVGPRTLLEYRLVRLWEEILGVEPIGVTDSFFELGGTSLHAVRLMTRLEEISEHSYPLSLLLRGATVEQFAAAMTGARPESVLVPMTPLRDKPRVYLVHPVGGNVICYTELAKALADRFDVCAIQSHGVVGESVAATIPEMAARYVDVIREGDPDGPFVLAGWSMGGVLAFEMAKVFRKRHGQSPRVVVIDAPSSYDVPVDVRYADLIGRFLVDLAGSSGLPESAAVTNATDDSAIRKRALETAQELNLLPKQMSEVQFAQHVAVFTANVRALAAYVPTPYEGSIDIVVAGQHSHAEAQGAGWTRLARSSSITELGANHYSIVEREHARAIAALIAGDRDERHIEDVVSKTA